MANDTATVERVDRLEEIMMQLAYGHTKTEMALREQASKKENDRRWGDLANKMGTLVEDIVAPSLPRIVREDFGCGQIDDIMLRRRVRNKTDQAQVREFDALVVAGDMVFINETKSKPRMKLALYFLRHSRAGGNPEQQIE